MINKSEQKFQTSPANCAATWLIGLKVTTDLMCLQWPRLILSKKSAKNKSI